MDARVAEDIARGCRCRVRSGSPAERTALWIGRKFQSILRERNRGWRRRLGEIGSEPCDRARGGVPPFQDAEGDEPEHGRPLRPVLHEMIQMEQGAAEEEPEPPQEPDPGAWTAAVELEDPSCGSALTLGTLLLLLDEVCRGESPECLSETPEPERRIGRPLEEIPQLPDQMQSFIDGVREGIAAHEQSSPGHDPIRDTGRTGWMQRILDMDSVHEIRRPWLHTTACTVQVHEGACQPTVVPIHLPPEVWFHNQKEESLTTIPSPEFLQLRCDELALPCCLRSNSEALQSILILRE